jgi:hypothetical protein
MLFGASRVDVRWIESLQADPPKELRGITNFLQIAPLTNPPRSDREIAALLVTSRSSTSSLVRKGWANPARYDEVLRSAALASIYNNLRDATLLSMGKMWHVLNATSQTRRGTNMTIQRQVTPPDVLERLREFFEPFERARRLYFEFAGLPQLPQPSLAQVTTL